MVQFIEYLKKNKGLILITVISAVLAWGYSLTNFTRTIDEERIISRWTNIKLWIGDGRYSIAFLRGILPYENIPYYHTFLFVTILILTALFLFFFFDLLLPNGWAALCGAAIFVSMPVHIYYESFCTYCEEIALAYLLTLLSVYFIYQWIIQKKRIFAGYALIFEIAALGIYQGFIPAKEEFYCQR